MNRMNIINKEICICQRKFLMGYFRFKSYYHTLELDSTASAHEIKTAYYKLSLQFHPDKNDGREESVAKFREITEAYEVLSNPIKKKIYDQEYNFQPQYTSRTYQSGKYYSPASPQGPYTGKTKDFNYDEHYRQHYERLRRQQEIDHEYFRRRWEADFHRRYPTKEEYYRNRYRDMHENSEQMKSQVREKRKSLLVLTGIWTFLLLIALMNDFINPDKYVSRMPKPVYYHAKTKEKDTTEDTSKGCS